VESKVDYRALVQNILGIERVYQQRDPLKHIVLGHHFIGVDEISKVIRLWEETLEKMEPHYRHFVRDTIPIRSLNHLSHAIGFLYTLANIALISIGYTHKLRPDAVLAGAYTVYDIPAFQWYRWTKVKDRRFFHQKEAAMAWTAQAGQNENSPFIYFSLQKDVKASVIRSLLEQGKISREAFSYQAKHENLSPLIRVLWTLLAERKDFGRVGTLQSHYLFHLDPESRQPVLEVFIHFDLERPQLKTVEETQKSPAFFPGLQRAEGLP
jgi:hypothetical protein